MKFSNMNTLIGLTWAILLLGLEAAKLRTDNISSSALLQQSITNTSLESSKPFGIANVIPNCILPCLGNSARLGGYGGAAFDDLNSLQLFGIESITVYSGSRIDSIQVTYKGNNPGPKHGGSGGSKHVCTVNDDPIVEIQARHADEIDALTFVKKSGAVCGKYGGYGGYLTKVLAPEGMVLGGIFGRAAARVDGLGFYWGRDPAKCDNIVSTKGRWVSIKNFPVETKYSIEIGTTHSDTSARSEKWGEQVSEVVSVGFDFFGASTKVQVTSTYSKETARSYSSTFSETVKKSVSYTFPPGTLWQWQFETIDECGTSYTYKDYQVTNNILAEPCCPPGLFDNPSIATGYCADDSVSLNTSSCLLKGNTQ